MSGLIGRILGAVALAATLFLSGCNFGADNAGDIYGSSQSSGEHTVPESQKRGTVTGEEPPDRARLGQ
jgi:outer membrane lipoprotein SlyB